MMKKVFFSCLPFFSPSLYAACSGNFFQTNAEIGLERSQLSGTIQTTNGTKLDLEKELGLSHSTAALKAMLCRKTTHHQFGFKLEQYEHSGSKKLSSNILFNGSQYATASLINSKVSLKWAKLKYRYRYTKNLSLGVDLNGMRLKTIVNENEVKKTLLLPALGIDYTKPIEEGLNFIAKGSSGVLNDSNYHYAYAGFSYDLKLLRCSSLHVGYQYKALNLKNDNFHANLKYQGIYAGLAMKF